jgi:hypothetical protein
MRLLQPLNRHCYAPCAWLTVPCCRCKVKSGSGGVNHTRGWHVATATARAESMPAAGFLFQEIGSGPAKVFCFRHRAVCSLRGHLAFPAHVRRVQVHSVYGPHTTHVISRMSDPWTARQCIYLAYVAEYTRDIQHIAGVSNVVADTLYRPAGHLLFVTRQVLTTLSSPAGSLHAGNGQRAKSSPLRPGLIHQFSCLCHLCIIQWLLLTNFLLWSSWAWHVGSKRVSLYSWQSFLLPWFFHWWMCKGSSCYETCHVAPDGLSFSCRTGQLCSKQYTGWHTPWDSCHTEGGGAAQHILCGTLWPQMWAAGATIAIHDRVGKSQISLHPLYKYSKFLPDVSPTCMWTWSAPPGI